MNNLTEILKGVLEGCVLEIISKELNGISNKTEKDSVDMYSSKLLNEVCTELDKIVNKESREYMSKINVNIYEEETIYKRKKGQTPENIMKDRQKFKQYIPFTMFKTSTPYTIKY